jgi:hypothetical protein
VSKVREGVLPVIGRPWCHDGLAVLEELALVDLHLDRESLFGEVREGG